MKAGGFERLHDGHSGSRVISDVPRAEPWEEEKRLHWKETCHIYTFEDDYLAPMPEDLAVPLPRICLPMLVVQRVEALSKERCLIVCFLILWLFCRLTPLPSFRSFVPGATSDCRAWTWPSSGFSCCMDFLGLGLCPGFHASIRWGLTASLSLICIGFWAVRSLSSCAGQPSFEPQKKCQQPRQIGLMGRNLSRLFAVVFFHGAMARVALQPTAVERQLVSCAGSQHTAGRAGKDGPRYDLPAFSFWT